jgi:hypothetical protein
VSCADSDNNPGRDQVVNVIKVDDGGNLIWTKKYFDANTQPYNFRNMPGDISFSPDDKMYMITGWRQEIGSTTEDRIFFFGIDRDGNVTSPGFKTLYVPGVPRNEDMIYDPFTKYFAVTLTHDGLDPQQYNYTYSTIGLITIDAGLNVNLHYMYWHYEAKENYGKSISLSVNKDYVIGCHTYDGSLGTSNPSILKTDNGGNPLLIMKYNIYDDVYFGHHCNSFNPSTGDEEYVLVAEHKTDLRVIRTDINAKTCGARDYAPIVKKYDYKEELFKYYPKEIGDIKKYEPKIRSLRPRERKCTDPTYDSYRPGSSEATGIANVEAEENGLTVYPTAVSLSNPVINFNNSSDNAVNVQVLDLSGRVVTTHKNVPVGNNSLNLGTNLSEGIYIVKYSSSNGEPAGGTKLIISK